MIWIIVDCIAIEYRVWDVGIRVGAAIRKYLEQEDIEIQQSKDKTHNSPRPHIRRAHWHSFWKGRKPDLAGRELILHWLPPIPIMVGDGELPTVIREPFILTLVLRGVPALMLKSKYIYIVPNIDLLSQLIYNYCSNSKIEILDS